MTTSEKLMDASQRLAKLSKRAKEAKDHASAAQNQAKADVEKSANEARARAEAHAEELHQSAAATGAQISASWNDMQKSWSNHMAQVRRGIETRRASLTRGGRRRASADRALAYPARSMRSDTIPRGGLRWSTRIVPPDAVPLLRAQVRAVRGWRQVLRSRLASESSVRVRTG